MINLNYIDVVDSIGLPENTFVAIDSNDGGNNENWFFATSVNRTASITSSSNINAIINSNVWTEVASNTNTWLRQG